MPKMFLVRGTALRTEIVWDPDLLLSPVYVLRTSDLAAVLHLFTSWLDS